MSLERLSAISDARAFMPRTRFHELANDHVPFDSLLGEARYESSVAASLISSARCVAIVGGRGAGKSSLIAHVCAGLPGNHIALRVPVTGADDAGSVSVMAAIALSTALGALELERHQHEALASARADEVSQTFATKRGGGKLGGGVVPVEISGELASLATDVRTNQLANDRLAGLDRLVSILVSQNLTPVFVMEDTEAIIGGQQNDELAERFFAGPFKAFLTEVDAPLLIAVQTPIAERSQAFAEMEPSLLRLDIPTFSGRTGLALTEIANRRLADCDLAFSLSDVLSEAALEQLAAWYEEADRSLRHTLAALQSAAEHAADAGAETIESPHMVAAISDWRQRSHR